MQYKRNESFRYDFLEPLQANYKVLKDGHVDGDDSTLFTCKIHDISPNGMKMFSDVDFGEYNSIPLQFEIHFILDEAIITAIGNVVWKKSYANGFMYGLIFSNQPKLGEAILTDLKARRRKEIVSKR